ncbi:MAG: Lrp/AsnC family transcriptional regulator [Pseudomonadota bacterium]
MTENRKLDEKDHEIIRQLREDAWRTHAELGEIVHLSASAVQRRVDRLRRDGVIVGAKAIVNESILGRGLRVYLLLELNDDSSASLRFLVDNLKSYSEITRVDLLGGKFDIIVMLDCKDMDSFTEVAMNAINTNANVRHCWTLMRLKTLTE